jgi:signal transduction histidine kinase
LLQRPLAREERGYLHVFYPEATYRRAWRDAVLPPFLLGFTALLIVVVLSLAIAQRVTRPIWQLRDGLEQIADGKFTHIVVPRRHDELRDLALSVNRLADKLSKYEDHVRRAERLRTLNQLGGGMAHQLRNSVTGCRMAVDLHRLVCRQPEGEELSIAIQQLVEMEGYLQRFLALGKEQDAPKSCVDLSELMTSLLPLVELRCRHLKVELVWQPPAGQVQVRGNPDALGQLLLNLLMNAMEAAAEPNREEVGEFASRRVVVRVVTSDASWIRLEVLDTGPGPPEPIREQLFEPLVSGKRDGAGLGLSMAREIAERHGGSLDWERDEGMTCFRVNLPRIDKEICDGDPAGG